MKKRFVFSSIFALALTGLPAQSGVQGVSAEPPRPPATLELRYAGTSPFGGQSAIFIARLSNNSDVPIASGELTAQLGYRWAEADADADGWQCTTDPQFMTQCTRTFTRLAPHLGTELPILMSTAAGVCLSAHPELNVILHLTSGDIALSARAMAPAQCDKSRTGLPPTGSSHEDGSTSLALPILLVVGSALAAFGVALRIGCRVRRRLR